MSNHDHRIVGFAHLKGKLSAVDATGQLKARTIQGVSFRPTRPVPHRVGHLTEILRNDWDDSAGAIVQVYMTTTLAGRIQGWSLHQQTTDRLFVARGFVRIVCFDGRKDSPTLGSLIEFTLSDRSPGLVIIEPDIYHAWQNVGTDESIIVNMPTLAYNYSEPDPLDLPWDSDEARSLIPVSW
jgi:dTDP-4-dehydrorhamnose 3,5-epimerase